jgi:hypothetical protein
MNDDDSPEEIGPRQNSARKKKKKNNLRGDAWSRQLELMRPRGCGGTGSFPVLVHSRRCGA